MLETLLKTALLGTRQPQPLANDLPEDLAALFVQRQPSSPAAELLDAAAATTLYARAGLQSDRGAARPIEAGPDVLPQCSLTAAELFTQLFDTQQWELVREWLEIAGQAGQRLPARLLPRLLTVAANHSALRDAALRIADARGRWLMQFNPSWHFATDAVSEELWQTGTRDERAAILAKIRRDDPARAQTLVATTWESDPAEERARWVEIFANGLSQRDEPLLESWLDDRSARVREAAAELLARLPQSRLVARMIERAAALLEFSPGSAGSVLPWKKGAKPRLEVKLPAEIDKSMLRDGLKEKPGEQLGVKQWHLLQILAHVPLAHWTERFAAPAEVLVAAIPDDYRAVLLRGWTSSFARCAESAWTLPLLEAFPAKLTIPRPFLAATPPPQREAVLQRLIADKSHDRESAIPHVLSAWRPLDEAVSDVVAYHAELDLISNCSLWRILQPSALEAVERRLAAAPDTLRRKLNQALSEIALRRSIHREFQR